MRIPASSKLGKLAAAVTAFTLLSFAQPTASLAAPSGPTIAPLVSGQSFPQSTLSNVSFSGQPLTGFTGNVEVRLSVLNGNGLLHVTQVTGMTLLAGYTSAASGNVPRLGYVGSQADANAMLATLQYLGDSSAGNDNIRIDVTNAIPYGTLSGDFLYGGHVYQSLLNLAGPISWSAASANANASSVAKVGGGVCPGYLATLNGNGFETSNKGFLEFTWIKGALPVSRAIWIGGSDQTLEGTWRWVTDPDDSSTPFWVGAQGGSSQNAFYSAWLPNREPNGGASENHAQLFEGAPNAWDPLDIYVNDAFQSDSFTNQYLIEYGSSNCQPVIAAENQAVSIVALTTVSTPSSVAALSAKRDGNSAYLNWTTPSSDGASSITDYAIQFQSIGASTWTTFAHATSTSTSARIQGISEGGYNFRVSAVNAIGQSGWSTATIEAPRPWTGPTIGVQHSKAARQVLTTGGTLEILGSGFDETTSVKLNGTTLAFDAKDPKLIKIQIPAGIGSPDLVFASTQGGVIYQSAFEYIAPKTVSVPQTLSFAGKVWSAKARDAILSRLGSRVAYRNVSCRIETSDSAASFKALRAFCRSLANDRVFASVNIVDARTSHQNSSSAYRIQFTLTD